VFCDCLVYPVTMFSKRNIRRAARRAMRDDDPRPCELACRVSQAVVLAVLVYLALKIAGVL